MAKVAKISAKDKVVGVGMKKLIVELENCYGIKKLERQFDFTDQRVFAIYAPNGAMKSSFAQTFKDIADSTSSKDRIFSSRITKRKITDENGTDLAAQSVLVVPPYDELFGHTEKTSTLLVDTRLRKEYEQLHIDIDKSKEAFLKALREQSGSKRDWEAEISGAFTKSNDSFYKALIRVKNEVLSQKDAPFAEIKYDTIFDDKVLAFLQTKDTKSAIEDYVRKYNELLAASTYFKKGTFNYYNASTIAKSLADNGFFDAKHTVRLNAQENLEITSQKQLEDLIAAEKEAITKDKALRKKFDDLDKLIQRNANVRDFRDYLAENEAILPQLANIESFKEEILKSYFKVHVALYSDLVDKYQAVEKRTEEIEDIARKQRTQWEEVIDIFNERFFVPFKLTAKNRTEVILGNEPILSLGFTFEDGDDNVPVAKETLLKVLSTGEKKALYILHIIFEIEARRKAVQETIFVVDDIADSFDYRNKYAIVQYLKDIAEEPNFKQIILTHNFDFFRTIHCRFVSYPHCLMAVRTKDGLSLEQAAGIRNVFVKDWKPNFSSDPKKKIACIPFIRNIIEYTKSDNDPDYLRLTSLLHWKPDTASITQAELDRIYGSVFNTTETTLPGNTPVIDVIRYAANECITASSGINFENKIVLSIAIRLEAERFMVEKINDAAFVAKIVAHQTQALMAKYKAKFNTQTDVLKTLQRVVLMTPENIHLNSFMYEPILDMSDEHLRKLYQKVLALNSTSTAP
jgi:hypothetical protein